MKACNGCSGSKELKALEKQEEWDDDERLTEISEYDIEEEEINCEICGSKKDLKIEILFWETREEPQDDRIICKECYNKDQEGK